MNSDLTRADFEDYYRHVVPKASGTADELRTHCPIHNGSSHSFAINLRTGLWFCHSQCQRGGSVFDLHMLLHNVEFKAAHQAVYEILGRPAPPFQGAPPPKSVAQYRQYLTPWRITATYEYKDENGTTLYRAVRKEKLPVGDAKPEKNFTMETPREGGWNSATGNMQGVRRILYRLPQLLQARSEGQWIWLVEGEKAVESLVKLGLTATCNPGGAGKWTKYRHDLNPPFAGARVLILPDNDDPGRRHAISVADNLLSVAEVVKIVELPDLPDKGDVVDWLATGGNHNELLSLANATPQLDTALFEAFKRQWTVIVKPKLEKNGNLLQMPEPATEKELVVRLSSQTEAEEEPPSTEAQEATKKELTGVLQARVLRFVQVGTENPSYRLETSKGPIRFKDIAQLSNQREFSNAAAIVTSHFITKHPDPAWIGFCNMLMSIKVIEVADPEAQPTGSTKAWLVEYLHGNAAHASWEEAIKIDDPDSRRLPHFDDARICISADHARIWCMKHRNETITYNRLAELLSDIGSTRILRSTHKPKTNITFYRLPAEFNSADYKIDITATPATESAYTDQTV